jgi:hypothetical protein
VFGWCDVNGEAGAEALPVVGIVSETRRWKATGEEEVHHDAHVIAPGEGLIQLQQFARFVDNGIHALVPCPWPPSQDVKRLAGELVRVRARALALHNAATARRPVKQRVGYYVSEVEATKL